MYIELSLFIAVILSGWVLLAFLLEAMNNRHNSLAKKSMHLEKRKCEFCASVYFVSNLFEFWSCPLCGSINKYHKP
jgi:hypothetical protein